MTTIDAKVEPDRATRSGNAETVRVWDPVVRIFHWSLVAAFIIAWATGDEFERLHLAVGYFLAGLIVVRIVWGFIGSRYARFADFLYGPKTVAGFLADTAKMRAPRYLGHNPAGGAMVIALLVMLTAISATGYMMTTDAYWGVKWVEEAHELAVNLTAALIGLHIVGVVVASIEHGENLAKSMLTGRKRI